MEKIITEFHDCEGRSLEEDDNYIIAYGRGQAIAKYDKRNNVSTSMSGAWLSEGNSIVHWLFPVPHKPYN